MNIQFNFISDLQATQCSWALQGENEYGSSCWPARYCIWVSPPGGESLPAGGAGSRAAWRCLRSPPGSQRALYGCRWGTKTNTNRYFGEKTNKQQQQWWKTSVLHYPTATTGKKRQEVGVIPALQKDSGKMG